MTATQREATSDPWAEEIPLTPAEALWALVPPRVRAALRAQAPADVTHPDGRRGLAVVVGPEKPVRLLLLAVTADGRVRAELVEMRPKGGKTVAEVVAWVDELATILMQWTKKLTN